MFYNNNNKNIIKDDLILKENIHNNLTSIHNKFVSLLKYKEENKKNERYIKSIPTRKSKNFLHILKSNESNKKLNNHGRVKSVDNNNINNNVPSGFTSNTVGEKSNICEAETSFFPKSHIITLLSEEETVIISVVLPNSLTPKIFPE